MSRLATQFARQMRTLRLQRNMSQAEISALTGIAQSTISSLENARQEPSWDQLEALARALDCSVTELLGEPTFELRDRALGIYRPDPPTHVMPVVGMVHAGAAEVTNEIVEELFPVRSVDWARTARITRIIGDCMEPEMPEGTYVGLQYVSNPRADLRPGRDIVVAVLPHDETVCRFFGGYWQSSTSSPWMITLVARNVAAYPPIVERARDCRIIGRVAWMHREL